MILYGAIAEKDDAMTAGGVAAGVGGGIVLLGAIVYAASSTDQARQPRARSATSLELGGASGWRVRF